MRLVCQVHFSAVFSYFCCLPERRVMQTGMTVQVALRLRVPVLQPPFSAAALGKAGG